MTQSSAKQLQQYIDQQITKLRQWVRPDPSDPLALKIIKGIFKSIVVLVLIAFSPIIIVLLAFAFLAAF